MACCVSANGIGVGCLFACGAREKKHDIWLRDKASAILFSLPGTCISASVKLLLAASRNRRRKRSAICGCFTDFLSQDFTMAWLSQQKEILLPRSRWAHAVAAARMANISCHWMDRCGSCWCGCQSPRSQAPPSRPHSLCYQMRLCRTGDLGLRPRLCLGTWPFHSMLEGTGATTECLPEPGCLV